MAQDPSSPGSGVVPLVPRHPIDLAGLRSAAGYDPSPVQALALVSIAEEIRALREYLTTVPESEVVVTNQPTPLRACGSLDSCVECGSEQLVQLGDGAAVRCQACGLVGSTADADRARAAIDGATR